MRYTVVGDRILEWEDMAAVLLESVREKGEGKGERRV